jgi:hypothetical protein
MQLMYSWECGTKDKACKLFFPTSIPLVFIRTLALQNARLLTSGKVQALLSPDSLDRKRVRGDYTVVKILALK